LAAFAAVDYALRQVTPPQTVREVEDALADYAAAAPHVLVIGSSHGRTFDVLGAELARRTDGAVTTLAIPVEFGKWSSYEWVLQHRVRPLHEATGPIGEARRGNLRHLVLATEWWDSTAAPGGGAADNLPSRAWQFGDFAADAARHGLTSYNKNYLQERFKRWFRWSTLVQDRGHDQILRDLKDRVRPRPAEEDARNYRLQIAGWQQTVETGVERIFDPYETAALERILAWADAAGLEVTVVLYPRMPGTLTAAAKAPGGTLAVFRDRLAALAAARGARFVDATTGAPIGDEHFARDFDHVTDDGHRILATWFLDGALGFLLDTVRPR